jgi:hypothetical protein
MTNANKTLSAPPRKPSPNESSLATDLIPKRGAPKLQSGAARKLARVAFRGRRVR